MPFARYKGEAENALPSRLHLPARVHLPGTIYPAFRALFPNQVIRADDLARAMVDVVVSDTGQRGGSVFENRDIRAMVKSFHPRLG